MECKKKHAGNKNTKQLSCFVKLNRLGINEYFIGK